MINFGMEKMLKTTLIQNIDKYESVLNTIDMKIIPNLNWNQLNEINVESIIKDRVKQESPMGRFQSV